LHVPIETQLLAKIETIRAAKETVPKTLRVLGRTMIRPEREAVVTAPQEGRLISTEEYSVPGLGDPVTKGQIIAIVEESIPAADLVVIATERARAASDLRQSEADLSLAQREYDRVMGLAGVVTDKDITAARNALEVAKAKRDGFTEQVALLDAASTNGILAQKRRVIRAPIDGAIAQTHVTIGENVGREKPLFHIVDISSLLVEADVFENDVASILSAKDASLTVEAFPGVAFPARLVSLGTAVDERTRALHMLFSVPNTERRLFAGMFGRVYIETGEETTGITVPKSAVLDVDGQQVVYVKTGGEQFTARPVRVTERLSDRLVLAESDDSVKEGDRVVVQGTYQIRMSKPVPSTATATGPVSTTAARVDELSAAPQLEAAGSPFSDCTAELESSGTVTAGAESIIRLRLKMPDGTPIRNEDMDGTSNARARVIGLDPGISDFIYAKPRETTDLGVFEFPVTPKFGGTYALITDVIPKGNTNPILKYLDLPVVGTQSVLERTKILETEIGGLRFVLSFPDVLPRAGSVTTARISISDGSGKPFTQLEPRHRTWAHVYGFHEGRRTFFHEHSIGDAIEDEAARGGPAIDLPLPFQSTGFHRLFVDFQVAGELLTPSFGVIVAP
jgi:RND family efflux transporter MFP subunit